MSYTMSVMYEGDEPREGWNNCVTRENRQRMKTMYYIINMWEVDEEVKPKITKCSRQATAAGTFSLVLWFGCAGQRSQKFEGLLDFDWDWGWCGQMVSYRSVTVLVGDVTGVDDRAVGSNVGRGSLDDRDRCAGGSGLQVADFLLFDSIFGFKPVTIQSNCISLDPRW